MPNKWSLCHTLAPGCCSHQDERLCGIKGCCQVLRRQRWEVAETVRSKNRVRAARVQVDVVVTPVVKQEVCLFSFFSDHLGALRVRRLTWW